MIFVISTLSAPGAILLLESRAAKCYDFGKGGIT